AALLNMIVNQPLEYFPGEKSIYSDIGFMILGYIVQCVSGERLDHYVHELVFCPLGLGKGSGNLFFVDLSDSILTDTFKKKYRFAATEDCPWRKKILKGEVHDDNAHVMGGIAGHAGLFGTAEGIYTLLTELDLCFRGKKKDGLFEKKLVERFFERNEKYGRTLGFDCPSAQGSASGRYFSEASVGHLGFTGVSFWMDMDKSVIIILLSNRVHPFRENSEIKKFRPLVHDIIMEELFY
ncbi:serine hydrolase, partial [Desulfobacterales bacterium HSG16]|nr:serine hydrolase [Desulfobacterales bacterium HSG16]